MVMDGGNMFWPWAFWRGYWLETEMYCYGYTPWKLNGWKLTMIVWIIIFLWGDFNLLYDAILVLLCWYSTVSGHVRVKPSCAALLGHGRGMGEDSCGCGRPHHPHSSSQHLGYLSVQWEVHRCPAALIRLKDANWSLQRVDLLLALQDIGHPFLWAIKIYSTLVHCLFATWRSVPARVGISWILSFTCSMLFFGSVVLQKTFFLDPTHLVQAAWPEQWTRMNKDKQSF